MAQHNKLGDMPAYHEEEDHDSSSKTAMLCAVTNRVVDILKLEFVKRRRRSGLGLADKEKVFCVRESDS